MYDEIMLDIDNDLMKLYEQGFVEIEYDEDLNALFRPTQKGAEWAKKMGFPEFPFPN